MKPALRAGHLSVLGARAVTTVGAAWLGALATFAVAVSTVGCDGADTPPGGADAGSCTPTPVTAADTPPEPARYTPRWAFEPWISKDITDQADTYAFVQGFRDRDIPVGAVVIDSPWETHYNTFVPNPKRFPDFKQLVADLHADDVKVVLWVTQMVNSSSFDLEPDGDSYDGPAPLFAEGRRCGLFVEGGDAFLWWKGTGGAVDFFSPAARAWWHRQQDPLLDLGIDGWKLDFGDQYVDVDPVRTAAGKQPHQAYSEAYYRDYLAYGRLRRGREFVTMVRPYDRSYGFPGRFYARPEHAPLGWVGDNRRDYVGIVDVLDHVFRSAQAGYQALGSDIGGYLDLDDVNYDTVVPFDTMVFAHWTAMSAFMPFFQLHGRANITPWTVPDHVDETVALYRYYAHLHHELVPFFYSLTRRGDAGGPTVIRPIGGEADWPDDWRFQVGEAFLIAPVFSPAPTRTVELPAGAALWPWAGAQDGPLAGGTTKSYDATQRGFIPAFLREGAIVPMHVDSDATGLGSKATATALTVLAVPSATTSSFELDDDDDAITTLTLGARAFTMSRALRSTYVRLWLVDTPTMVELDGTALTKVADRGALEAAPSGWFTTANGHEVWVKVPAKTSALALQW